MKKIIIISLFLIGITMWAPWLNTQEVLNILEKDKSFVENKKRLNNPSLQVGIFRIPFGYWVTTVEGGWFVGFWNGL